MHAGWYFHCRYYTSRLNYRMIQEIILYIKRKINILLYKIHFIHIRYNLLVTNAERWYFLKALL